MDEYEFTTLYHRNARRLYNFILWTTGNRSVCDDILQTVFIKVWRSPTVPADPGEQTAWIYAVARNACTDYFRSGKRNVEYREEIGEAAEPREKDDDGKIAWSEVAQLQETERAIVYLHLRIGYSYAEIGRLLDMTEINVRVKAFRALRKLRAILIRKGL